MIILMVGHRKRVRHFHTPGHFHEFTFSCYGRKTLLTNDDWLPLLSQAIDDANRLESMELVAFVYMPEHLHLLTYPLDPEPNLGRYLARIKQPFSRRVKKILQNSDRELLRELTIRERPERTVFRFLQEGPGYDRNLFTTAAIDASIDYIHDNPVRRGLCERAVDWKWSSARYYLGTPPKQQFAGLPRIHGISPDALSDLVPG